VALDGDSQAVQFVKPHVLHRPGLSVGQDHGFADKLSLGLLERAENRRARSFTVGMGDPPESDVELIGVCIRKVCKS
jgi:hypothetical protein